MCLLDQGFSDSGIWSSVTLSFIPIWIIMGFILLGGNCVLYDANHVLLFL